MFVNKIPFFMSLSRNICFITAEVLNNRKQPTLTKALQQIHGIYSKQGFCITLILGDSKFECNRGAIVTNLHSEDEHVPDIERCIRTVKERTRCTYNMTPFEHFPPRMIIEMVFLNIFWLNTFPHRLGVSQTLSPRTIVTGLGVDYTKHCRIEYGQCVQTHEKHDNTMKARTVGALALHPTGNQQGGHYFYSLMSGQRLHRTHWTELPMPAEVKDRVHALVRRANAKRGLTFTDSHGNNLDELYPDADEDNNSDYDTSANDDASYASSEDSDYNPNTEDRSTDDRSSDGSTDHDFQQNPDLTALQPAEIAGVNANNDDTLGLDDITRVDEEPGINNDTPGVYEALENNADTPGVDETPEINEDNEPIKANEYNEPTEANEENEYPDLESYVNELETEPDKEIAALDSDHDTTQEQASADKDNMPNDSSDDESHGKEDDNTPIPRLRRNRAPSYQPLKGRAGDGSLPTIARHGEFKGGRHQSHIILQSVILTQYNLKQGIKKFGDQGKAAVLTELRQLYDRDVMDPVNKYNLTPAERKGALRYLMFLKEKRGGTIKGRGCAIGRPQRDYMS
jgi:hypothetical protein